MPRCPDHCPGVLQLHEAADGPLARIRLPGGRVSPEQLRVLAEAADDLGDRRLELTSRGNVQLRAIADPDDLAARMHSAGLLPSSMHERVRNIVASPLSGRAGGQVDLGCLTRRLDESLCARPTLAQLPGRVLFSLDDGRGDVSALGADFGIRAVSPDRCALMLAGVDTGARIAVTAAVDVLLGAAQAFLDLRTDEWRLDDLADGRDRLLDALGLRPSAAPCRPDDPTDPPIGSIPQDDGLVALAAGVRLGILDLRLAELLTAVERPLIVTPWRSIVVADLDEHAAEEFVRRSEPLGLIFDADSPWLSVSACVGRPGCARSLADVRADATVALVRNELPVAGRQHWSGCDRRCGRPQGAAVDVIATATGYRLEPG